MNISIVGTGYVGLTTAAILSNIGHKVYCIDIDEKKLATIAQGKSYFFEPGLDEFVKKGIESGNLIPTTDYGQAIPKTEIAFLTVGTPARDDGSVNLDYIFAAAKEITEHAQSGLIVVTKSTVPVGTGRKIERIIEEKGADIDVLSCPEFLAEGSAVFDTLNADRIVVGGDSEQAKQKVLSLLQTLDDYGNRLDLSQMKHYGAVYKKKINYHTEVPFNNRVVNIGLESAELIKVTANAFLATKISFANSVARICDKTEANVTEVMDGIGMDPRIGRDFLYAGLGWGGGCFPKDVAGLRKYAETLGIDYKLIKAVEEINYTQPDYVAQKAVDILGGDLNGKTIAIWGLAFKPGTSDVRLSPAISVIQKLLEAGVDQVNAYDPEAMEESAQRITDTKIKFTDSAATAVVGADLLILATDWPEFLQEDFAQLKPQFRSANILDARNRLNANKLSELGFNYSSIGN